MIGSTMQPLEPTVEQSSAEQLRAEPALSVHARRSAAVKVLQTAGLPSSRAENWRYAKLRAFQSARFFSSVASINALQLQLPLPELLPDFCRIVFIDGHLAADLSSQLPPPITLKSGIEKFAEHAWDESAIDNRFAVLNAAFASQEWTLQIAATEEPSKIELLFVTRRSAQEGISYPRLKIEVSENTKLYLVERHVSDTEFASLINGALAVRLAERAELTHARLQQLTAQATWLDTTHAELASDSVYRLQLLNLEASATRSTTRIALQGQRARFDLQAAALGRQQQVHDLYLNVQHLAEHTESRQTFRGIAENRAVCACNSKVVVQTAATDSHAQQNLRGLNLSAEAEIALRPQLQIHTDEVRCSHGATTGKLDENMLFYLLSRGIEREAAEHILKWVFVESVVSAIQIPAIRAEIERAVATRMGHLSILEPQS
jgi:Fe-S cluster assembly protein SufD